MFSDEHGRGKLEIIEDVLFVARNGAQKTEIVYKTILNFLMMAEKRAKGGVKA